MKKLFMVAAFALAAVSVNAQNAVGQWTIQPKIGMNIANLTELEGDAKVGFAAGLEVEYGVTDIFSISAGALYSMQGSKWEANLPLLGKTESKINLGYINVPIMANVYVTKGLAVKLGLQPGFCVSKDDTDCESFDFSIPVGLSYEYSNFVLDARYNWGLTKVWDVKGDAPKNSVFQITLGYKFAL